jgi:hypothetical protein
VNGYYTLKSPDLVVSDFLETLGDGIWILPSPFLSSKYCLMRLSTINERWCLGTTLINSESGFSSIVKDVLFLLRDNYPQVLFPQKSFSLFDEIQLE